MSNDEIKTALRRRCRIRDTRDGIVYERAFAWRVTVDPYGEFVSSLELLDKSGAIVIVPAQKCEIVEGIAGK